MIKTNRYKLYHGDCIKVLSKVKTKVDLILTDSPYATTSVFWDIELDYKKMWNEIHDKCRNLHIPILLFANMKSAVSVINSNPKEFRYEWIWEKSRSGSAITAKYCPIKIHEYILVFSSKTANYFPIMEIGDPYDRVSKYNNYNNHNFGIQNNVETHNKGTRFPKSIRYVKQNWSKQQQIHPTQKPVELLEYLIQTYTKENDVVLDFTMGSGSTGVACMNTHRRFIGIEKDKEYFDIAYKRIKNASNSLTNLIRMRDSEN